MEEDDEFDDVDVEGEEDDDFDEEEAADFLRAAEEGNLGGVQIVREKPELQEVQDEVSPTASRQPAHAPPLPPAPRHALLLPAPATALLQCVFAQCCATSACFPVPPYL